MFAELKSKIVNMLEGYADSYDVMARIAKTDWRGNYTRIDESGKVNASSVAVDIRQNMVKFVQKIDPASEWISVATPPKACTEVLVWRADSGPFIAQLVAPCDVPDADDESDDLRWLADAYGWQEGSETPTHWMPLPEGPK